MTQEQINEGRIAIAEKCGFEYKLTNTLGARVWHGPNGQVCSTDEDVRACRADRAFPDYYGSLDAMHEAEKVLTLEQSIHYMQQLSVLDTDHLLTAWAAVHATAPQRFEAMLRVLGAWQEDAS